MVVTGDGGRRMSLFLLGVLTRSGDCGVAARGIMVRG